MVIDGRMKKGLIVGATLFGAFAMVGTDMTWLAGFTGDSEADDAEGPAVRPPCRTIQDCDSRCVKGEGVSCYYAGQGRLRGVTGKPDPVGASVLFARACKAGTVQGCTLLGTLHEQGAGVPRDLFKARDLFQQACAGADPQGCAGLARLDGSPAPATPDPEAQD